MFKHLTPSFSKERKRTTLQNRFYFSIFVLLFLFAGQFLPLATRLQAAALASTSPAYGLWQLNEGTGSTTVDSSTYGNTGTLVNGPLWTTDTPAVQFTNTSALSFDGVDDYVNLGAASTIDTLTNNFTVLAWIKPARVVGVQRILSANRLSVNNGFGFGLSNNNLHFQLFGLTAFTTDSAAIPTGAWTHVAVVMAADNSITFYVDGVAKPTLTNASAARAETGDNLIIGGSDKGNGIEEPFQGVMDEIHIYPQALSATEINNIRSYGQPDVVPTATATSTNTPLPTATSTNTPLPTATSTNTPLPTATSTNTPLPTATSTNTPLPTATSTNTPLPTATSTNTPLPTATSTNTPLPTATSTNTPLPTATSTNTPLPTATSTNTPLPTATSTNTPLPTATSTNTPLPTATSTNTPLPTATSTNTPLPTATDTNTPLPTATSTDTPLPTVTDTLLPTATSTSTSTPGAATCATTLCLRVTQRNGTVTESLFSQADLGVVDTDFIHLEVLAPTMPQNYQYKLVEQSTVPTATLWNTLPLRPFYEDMFFYRRPQTQWIQLVVTDGNQVSHLLQIALQGGVLSAPPDDPILPADYVLQIERGFDASFSEFAPRVKTYQEAGIVAFKKAGMDHLRIRTEFPATEEDLFSHMDRSIDDTLRHGLVPILAYQGTAVSKYATAEDKLAAIEWWRRVSERYHTRSHKLSFNLFVELLGSEGLSNWPTLNEWYGPITSAIRGNTADHNIIYTSIHISDPCELVNPQTHTPNLQVPPNAGDYYFVEWHNWAAGPSMDGQKGWVGYAGTDAFKAEIRQSIQCALDWTAISGKPTWFGAWMPALFNVYQDHWYVTEAVEFSKYLSNILETLPGFTQNGVYKQSHIPWAVNADHKYYDMESGRWYTDTLPMMEAINGPNASVDPNDTDGDGLTTAQEAQLGTSPTDSDSDQDLILDNQELANGLNPTDPTDGLEADSDGDGMPNKFEARFGFNPHDASDGIADLDGDGLVNRWEYLLRYDPSDAHTGKAQQSDAEMDRDGDGLTNLAEISGNPMAVPPVPATDPRKADSDDDGLNDNVELAWPVSNGGPFDPSDGDMDNDGLLDGVEITYGLNPRNSSDGSSTDTDHDRVTNGDEIRVGLNPTAGYDGLGATIHAAVYQQKLGAGIDLTWSLWGRSEFFTVTNLIAARGFDHVRIEVRDPATTTLFTNLDKAIQNFLRVGVIPVLSYDVPTGQTDMKVLANRQAFIQWWSSVAQHYALYSHRLGFDLTANLYTLSFANAEDANGLMNETASAIRTTLNTRVLFFTPPFEGKDSELSTWVVPTTAKQYALAKWNFRRNGPVAWNSNNLQEKTTITNTLRTVNSWQQSANGIPVYHSPWRSYKGATFTLSQQIAYSEYMVAAMTFHGNIPGSVMKLDDYLKKDPLVWDTTYTDLVNRFVALSPATNIVSTTTSISPEAGGTLTMTNNTVKVAITFDPATVDSNLTLEMRSATVTPTILLPLVGAAFVIEAETQDGQPVTTFTKPYKLVVSYAGFDLSNIDESELAIHFWNETTQTWEAIPTLVDPVQKTLTAYIDHLTLFATLERAPTRLYLPLLQR